VDTLGGCLSSSETSHRPPLPMPREERQRQADLRSAQVLARRRAEEEEAAARDLASSRGREGVGADEEEKAATASVVHRVSELLKACSLEIRGPGTAKDRTLPPLVRAQHRLQALEDTALEAAGLFTEEGGVSVAALPSYLTRHALSIVQEAVDWLQMNIIDGVTDPKWRSERKRLNHEVVKRVLAVARGESRGRDGEGEFEDNCVICLDDAKRAVILPCGHIATCRSCGELLKAEEQPCPICREPITDVYTVFKT
jgi:hypothetical protein